MKQSYDANAPTHPTIIQWENAYKLPVISGTAKQQKYARDIRYRLMMPLLTNLLEFADTFKPVDRPLFFATINNLRGDTDPAFWIQLHQDDIDIEDFVIHELEAIHEYELEALSLQYECETD